MSARSGASSRPLGAGHPLDDCLEQLRNAGALLGGDRQNLLAPGPDQVDDLLGSPLRLRPGQVDLVEDRDDFEAGVERQEEIGERLSLDPLRRIHDEDRAFAGGEGPGHFVGEVHVSRGVDQVELIVLAVGGTVAHSDSVELDGDAALALEVHRVEQLLAHEALFDRTGGFDQPVGQGALAVIDVCDNAEIADAGLRHGGEYKT